VLTAEPTAPEVPVAIPTGMTSDGAPADLQLEDPLNDPWHCEKAKECAKGYACSIELHRCVLDPN
jgi:hypothetical protein